ncbi:MAG: [FeFe] hydrogenase H-cluster maturation GTPase HydF [Stygiobacter sp.]|uniref:[FeFe] hydrogenase H-cluster maturation GTPase HydF n=1 Tax=Stygiobacter electus TaxID=3032292 RepID=A0AAE3TDV7_9BACT|nr:[FeFe] hydrogenase H-cluster maturation GTPase HydF [Stygiobacter electus]MDF1611822.1 [FeFe] hydrogenase H-cluster maturation GTPase HydF [Stygiobacter electus]
MSKVTQSERLHISFVGRRNVGKSSLMNKFIGQELVIVSDVPGTTTDPVKKSMELLPFGPVVLIDTAGIDDVGELGEKRISKTIKVLTESDFSIVVLDSQSELSEKEKNLFAELKNLEIPFIAVINKSELGINYNLVEQLNSLKIQFHNVSCLFNDGIYELKEKIIKLLPNDENIPLISDLIKQHDVVVLVVPIDLGAPKGRLILPQVQTIRESLDVDSIVVVAKDKELRSALSKLNEKPKLVVTDSQAIMRVNADVPDDISLTTFSILMARYKGDLVEYVKGLKRIEELQNGDKVLIAEACTHHEQEDDIGKIKIPRWLRLHTKKDLEITHAQGYDYPENLKDYKLIIHCGGCMLTRKMVQQRIKQAKFSNVPIVNYGVAISYMHGAIPRAIKPFPEAINEWNNISKI